MKSLFLPNKLSMIKKNLYLLLGLGLVFSNCTEPESPAKDNLDEDNVSTEKPNEEKSLEFSFSKLSEMPTSGRKWAFSFKIDHKIYVGTGFGTDDSGQKYLDDFWEYDTENDIWTEKASFPLGTFSEGEAVGFNGKGYVFFGKKAVCETINVPCDHIEFSAVHAYDPNSDTWELVADFSGQPGLRGGHATLLKDKVFFVKDFSAYEISLMDFTLKQLSNPPDFITGASSFLIDEKIFFMMGMSDGNGIKACYSYNTLTDQWQTLSDFPESGRFGGVGFSKDGMGYIIGGKQGDFSGQNEQFKDVWQFNPSKSEWKKVAEYPGAAYSWKVLQIVDNEVYVGLGDKRNFLTFEKDWWKLSIK